jgi:hypothetical protein
VEIAACLAAVSAISKESVAVTPLQSEEAGISIACQPDRVGNRLIFPYALTNTSPELVYVMDATPKLDPVTKTWSADRESAVVWLGADDVARVMKGIAPLPIDTDVWARVIPLAAKLPPGETLERRLEIPLPLGETSPYFPDLPLRQYRQQDIKGITLIVEFLPSSVEGFAAAPVDYGAGLFHVRGSDTTAQVRRVGQTYPVRHLSILKRPDNFPRPA